jgi:Tfp pilus assembly protein PilN
MGAPNELSFLPDDYLERKARRRTNAICAILFLIVISSIGGAFTVTERSMREIDQQYAAVEQQYTDAAKRIDQVQQMQEKQRTMAHQAELTASLLEKVPRSFLLAELTNGMPEGVSLLDFQLDAKVVTNVTAPQAKTAFELRKAEAGGPTNAVTALASAQPRIYDVSMKATGLAQTDVQVAQFISRLNSSKLLKDVNLIFTDEFEPNKEKNKDSTNLRKFAIEMTLNPDAKVDVDAAQVRLKTAAMETSK